MPTHIFRGLISGSLLALTAASAVAGYPTAPEIADRYAAQSIAVRLTDAFVAPKSSTGWGATTAQVARINFLRPEPVAGLAASRLFINDMNGRLSIVDRATGSFSTYLDFDAIFNGVGSGDFDADPGYAAGLVTMEFDPAYATNGKFYTVHTELGPGSAIDYRQAVLSEWEDTNIADGTFTGTRAELLRVDYVNRIHPLGDISFNPAATDPSHPDWRNMYIASGDGGSGESRGGARDNPQRLDSLVGKILRILPTEAGTGGGYAIPADNPFAATTGANPAVFATGLRNPHRLSWDIDEAGTARGLISDIGLYAYEEVNLLTAGVNYGYSRIEGDQVLGADNRVSDDPLPTTLPLLGAGGTTLGTSEPTYPLAFYSHLDGDAIAGGFVYRGQAIPALQGKFVFGDITNARLFYADLAEMLAAGGLFVLGIVRLDQPCDHRPILVALGFLRGDEVGERQDIDGFRRCLERGSPVPKRLEIRQPAELCHHVETDARRVGYLAPEVDGVASQQKASLEGRNGNYPRLEIIDRRLQPGEIGGIRHHEDVGVAAKLRPAVQDARLAAHQQRAHAIPPDRRKDFEDRARGQANLPVRGTSATVSTSPPAVEQGSARTTPPIRHQKAIAVRSCKVSTEDCTRDRASAGLTCPLNKAPLGERLLGGRNQGRARDATEEAGAGPYRRGDSRRRVSTPREFVRVALRGTASGRPRRSPEAPESLGSRKTVAEVPLSGLSPEAVATSTQSAASAALRCTTVPVPGPGPGTQLVTACVGVTVEPDQSIPASASANRSRKSSQASRSWAAER